MHRALEQRRRAVDHLVEGVVGHGLVLAAGAVKDDAAVVARLVEDRLGERALADARLAGDERHVAGALFDPREQIAQDRALGGAADDAAVGERGKLVRAPLARAVARRGRRSAAGLERLARGARRGEALLGPLGQEAQHPQLEIGRNALDAIGRGQGMLIALRVQHLPLRAGKGRLAAQHLVDHRAERVEIAAGVERATIDLLRAHVGRRAGEHGVGEVGRVGGAGEPEVEDLHVAAIGDHDVRRLEIAVHDAGGGQALERVEDLRAGGVEARQVAARLRCARSGAGRPRAPAP